MLARVLVASLCLTLHARPYPPPLIFSSASHSKSWDWFIMATICGTRTCMQIISDDGHRASARAHVYDSFPWLTAGLRVSTHY